MKHLTLIRLDLWRLRCPLLFVLALGCSRTSEGPGALADEHGRVRRWRIENVRLEVCGAAETDIDVLRLAAKAWSRSGAPTLAVVPASFACGGPREDGVSQLRIVDSRTDAVTHDSSRDSKFRLRPGLLGLTEVRTGLRDGQLTITEADVLLDRGLSGPELQRIATHEFGHVLGLLHAPTGSSSIMEPDPKGSPKPSDTDIAALKALYR